MATTSVHVVLRSFPDYFRATGKLNSQRVPSQTRFKKQKKIGFLEEHSLHIINEFSFIHFAFFFLSTLKGNTKIWLCTGGGRRRASRVSYFSLGISFSVTLSKS